MFQAINPGKYRHKVEVWFRPYSTSGEIAPDYQPNLVLERRCSIKVKGGTETEQAEQPQSQRVFEVEMWSDQDTRLINASLYYFVDSFGRTLQIESVDDHGGMLQKLTFKCVEMDADQNAIIFSSGNYGTPLHAFRSEQIVGFEDEDSITNWPNEYGSIDLETPSTGSSLDYKLVATPNEKPGATRIESGDFKLQATNASYQSCVIFLVCKLTPPASNGVFFRWYHPNNSEYIVITYGSNGKISFQVTNSPVNSSISFTPTVTNQWCVLRLEVDGTNTGQKAFINGVQQTPDSPPGGGVTMTPDASSIIRFGGYFGSNGVASDYAYFSAFPFGGQTEQQKSDLERTLAIHYLS